MNCGRFEEHLYDYLDGALTPKDQAVAAEHLSQCQQCRELLQAEKAAATSISKLLRERVERLTLSTRVQQEVLQILKRAPAQTRPFAALALLHRMLWPAAIATPILIAIAFLLRNPSRQAGRHAEFAQSGDATAQAAVVAQNTFISATYTFRADGDQVVDLLEYKTNLATGIFLANKN
jgi:predicted anti-sigma-YlaC factor YlaD